MTHEFNLVDEPWIPCLMQQARFREFSLLETLTRAHELGQIVHESPLVVVAVHRLLLAVLHSVFGPKDMAAWVTLWNRGAWDAGSLEDYLSEWKHRFDLFHPEKPFFQFKSITKKDGVEVEWSEVQRLAQQLSVGSNKVLFDHTRSSKKMSWPPGEAARYLLAAQVFALGGGVSYPFNLCDGPATKGYSLLALGDNLFETLALNLIVCNDKQPFPSSLKDMPFWEQETLRAPNKNGTVPLGYLDYLTWPSRQISLHPESDNTVNTCRFQQNLRLPEDFNVDPFKAYLNTKKGIFPKALSPTRAIWRDSAALFQLVEAETEGAIRPIKIMDHLQKVEERRIRGLIKANKFYRFQVVGMASQGKAANIVLWRREILPLPLVYFSDPGLLALLESGLAAAEGVAGVIESKADILAMRFLYPQSAESNWKPNTYQKKEIKRLMESLNPGRDYWAGLENPFRRLMLDLAEVEEEDRENDLETILNAWADEIRRAAEKSFQILTKSFQGSGKGLKAAAQAERGFYTAITKVFEKNHIIREVKNESVG